MANKACNEVVTVANMPKTVFDMISAMQNKYADRVAFRYVEGKDTVVEKTYAQYVQRISAKRPATCSRSWASPRARRSSS